MHKNTSNMTGLAMGSWTNWLFCKNRNWNFVEAKTLKFRGLESLERKWELVKEFFKWHKWNIPKNLILLLKTQYWSNVWLDEGNHEVDNNTSEKITSRDEHIRLSLYHYGKKESVEDPLQSIFDVAMAPEWNWRYVYRCQSVDSQSLLQWCHLNETEDLSTDANQLTT